MSVEEIAVTLDSNEDLKELIRIVLSFEPELQQKFVSALTEWMRLPEEERTREKLEKALEPYM